MSWNGFSGNEGQGPSPRVEHKAFVTREAGGVSLPLEFRMPAVLPQESGLARRSCA